MDVYYDKDMNKYELPGLIIKINKGTHAQSTSINKFQTTEITIKLKEQTVCNIDGDEITDTNFKIKILPQAITLYNNQELIKKVLD